MSHIETFEGLCGQIATFASSDLQLRCLYSLGHHGKCSWSKYEKQFHIDGSCNAGPSAEQQFENSVMITIKENKK